jgi:hypothetical protein
MNVLQQRINELVERHGSIRAAARVLDVDPVYLYRLSTGEKDACAASLLTSERTALRKRRSTAMSNVEPQGPSHGSEPNEKDPSGEARKP